MNADSFHGLKDLGMTEEEEERAKILTDSRSHL